MGYKIINGLPSPRANSVELADFVEVECLKKQHLRMSFLDVVKSLDTNDDYQENDVDEDGGMRDSREERRVEEAFNEIEQRIKYCNNQYPFYFQNNLLHFDQDYSDNKLVYIYLLLATRLKMGGEFSEKIFNEIDGALLFEDVCQKILQSFWGNRSKTYLFGTAAQGGFGVKVEELIQNLHEGSAYKNRNEAVPDENDGGLDIVVWKGFSDERGSQLIGFAQCKTGTSWKEELGKTQPGNFIDKWFSDSAAHTPANIFMISDILRHNFFSTALGYVFFDRCRIMDFLPVKIEENQIIKIKSWILGASEKYRFQIRTLLQ